ncbi:GGDEF domain-containing protein [Corallincola spongiicola]|uniref:diguanylate cyclase n=1 Tax=Corallincola spongiicola TaxID=2520508 RepID=A0ABY1WSM8_9GAMM|nr:GGDEF domain-containing protein [Corallincola spongiicola]TAA47568.1 GGDEF domain-containing protein [Corallincola spongiicola]
MSRLTTRLLGIFVLAFAVGLITLLASRYFWLQPTEIATQDTLDRATIERYQLALKATSFQLKQNAAQLDNNFFQRQINQGWHDKTFDAAWLLDSTQQLLLTAGKEPISNQQIAPERLTLLLSQILNQPFDSSSEHPVWLNTPSGAALVVKARNELSQQVVAIQLWTAARINTWQTHWSLPLNAIWLHDNSTPGSLRRAAASLIPYSERSPVRMSDKLRWVIADSSDTPLMLWEVSAPTTLPFSGLTKAQICLLIGWLVALVISGTLILKQFIQPQLQLKKALQQRNIESDYHHPITITVGDGLTRECNLLMRHIQQQDNRLLKLSHQVELLSKTDTLTGLANRQRLEEFLEQEWSRAKQLSNYLCFGLCDLDMFKSFNERYGVALGDSALKEVAKTLEGNLHRATDLVARLSGATFAIILTDTDGAGAKVVGDKLLQAISELNIPHADSEHKMLSISIGCLPMLPEGNCTIELLLAQANHALVQAKSKGGNQVSVTSNKV